MAAPYHEAGAWSPDELDDAVDAYLGRSSAQSAPNFHLATRALRQDQDDAAARDAARRQQPAQGYRQQQQQQQQQRPPAAAASSTPDDDGGNVEDMVDSILTPVGAKAATPAAYSVAPASSNAQRIAQQPYDADALVGATPLGDLAAAGDDTPYAEDEDLQDHHIEGGERGSYDQPDFRGSSERSGSRRSGVSDGALRVDTELMIRRMAMWKARKDRTIAAKRQEAAHKELEQCTFQPLVADDVQQRLHSPERLLGPSTLYRDNRAWGTEEFLQRQERARKLRQEKEQHAKEVFSSGTRWQHRTTVPRPFAIGTHRHRSRDALATGGAPHGGGMTSVGAGSSRGMAKMVASLRTHFDAEPSRIEAPSVPPGAFSAALPGRGPPRGGSHDDHWNAQLDQMVSDML